MSYEQFEKLERALCSAEGLGTLNRTKKDAKQKTAASNKTESSSVEDSDASTNTDPPMPSASSPERVFEPRPPQSSREGRSKVQEVNACDQIVKRDLSTCQYKFTSLIMANRDGQLTGLAY